MIGRLTGQVVECRPDHVVLDVGGVGYHLHIPLSAYYRLCDGNEPVATLHVHTHVREDAIQLYGFSQADEKEAFELLIGISGIGPRVALAVLSGIGVAELFQAVRTEDRARLQKIPGVGKKTAERVLLELRDRPARRGRLQPAAEERSGRAGEAGSASAEREMREDAISALVNLGYSTDTAVRAVDGARGDPGGMTTLESLLKAALIRLGMPAS